MAQNKCKDCTYFEQIDSPMGYCKRYPPLFGTTHSGKPSSVSTIGEDRYPNVTRKTLACGEFVAEE